MKTILFAIILLISLEKEGDCKSYKEKMSVNKRYGVWCPEKCKKEGEIYVDRKLSSYRKCEKRGIDLTMKKYSCNKFEIYNATTQSCYKLAGGGFTICVFTNRRCPFNETGIRKHPNPKLFKHYLICLKDKIIVARCKMWYYNRRQQKCKQKLKKKTIVLYSDCKKIPLIKCIVPKIISVEQYFRRNNISDIIPQACKNCYYFCNDGNLNEFHLTIQCFPQSRTTGVTAVQNNTLKYPNKVGDAASTTGIVKYSTTRTRIDKKNCTKQGFFRYANSCTKHYECYYSKKHKKLIPSDVYECPHCCKFNVKLMRCDYAENVPECTYKSCCKKNTMQTYCTGPGKFPVPNNSSRYYKCVDIFHKGEYVLKEKVCLKRKYFHEEKGKCSVKVRKPQLGEVCGDKKFIYDKYSCSKFFHCHTVDGILVPKRLYSCPDGYIFNGEYCQHQNEDGFRDCHELSKHMYKHNK